MTVNALQPSVKIIRQQKYTQNDLMIDPLIVLRCDQRVHRYVSPSGLPFIMFHCDLESLPHTETSSVTSFEHQNFLKKCFKVVA